MLNIIFALLLMALVIWSAKKIYDPVVVAEHPERYPQLPEHPVSRRALQTMVASLERWRGEGKISREEYEHLTALCHEELQNFPQK